MSGRSAGSQGVIQVHADLAQLLTDGDASTEQQQQRQAAQWEDEAESEYEDEPSNDSFAAAVATTNASTSVEHAAASTPSPSPPPQPRRSSSSTASQPAAAASKASKPRKQHTQPFQPKTKKVASYADRYAVTVGRKQPNETKATIEQPVANAASAASPPVEDAPQPAANVDILVIAPFTADGVRQPSPPACVDEAELAARYPDYFDDTAADADADEYEHDDEPAATDNSLSHHYATATTEPHSAAVPSQPSYQPYSMSDFRTLPKEVKLGRLGANIDPADMEARQRKRRDMKELERQVRADNKKRLERADKQRRMAAVKAEEACTAASTLPSTVGIVREEKQQLDGNEEVMGKAALPSDGGHAGKDRSTVTAVEVERKDGDASDEKKHATDTKVRNNRRASMDRLKQIDKSNGRTRVKRDVVEEDVVSQLLAQQEKERQKVLQIRQSLGLR